MRRTVFFVSDGTAITAETFGRSLMTQFSDIELRQVRLPFVDTASKADDVVGLVDRARAADGGRRSLIFSTIVDPEIYQRLRQADAHFFDLFATYMGPLEEALRTPASPQVGRAHGIGNSEGYEDRMEATNYALTHDDGISTRLDAAEVILVGVSRSGKTPTCLYMALHFGVRAANYPLTEEDLEQPRLPDFLRKYKNKLFGLNIDPERLSQIRQVRRPDSRYASIRQCRYEVEAAEAMLRAEGVPIFDSTETSVEELASRILLELGLNREMR